MLETVEKGLMSETTRERMRSLRESLGEERRKLAPSLLKDICPDCKRRIANQAEDKPPCAYYSPDNVYYDSTLKRFWCRWWK